MHVFVMEIFLCMSQKFSIEIVSDVQNATCCSHRAPCPARDLLPWLIMLKYIDLYEQHKVNPREIHDTIWGGGVTNLVTIESTLLQFISIQNYMTYM